MQTELYNPSGPLRTADRPVSNILCHRNARPIALTNVLSTCGAAGGMSAPRARE